VVSDSIELMETLLHYNPMVFFGITLVLLGWVVKLNLTIKKLVRGRTGESLESIILENNKAITSMMNTQENHKKYIIDLQQNILNTIQNVGIVRFKALNTGGNQSFAIALTNKHKDGLVLSSLYTTQHVQVFAKPITNGTSNFTLSEEEQQALNQAHQ